MLTLFKAHLAASINCRKGTVYNMDGTAFRYYDALFSVTLSQGIYIVEYYRNADPAHNLATTTFPVDQFRVNIYD